MRVLLWLTTPSWGDGEALYHRICRVLPLRFRIS